MKGKQILPSFDTKPGGSKNLNAASLHLAIVLTPNGKRSEPVSGNSVSPVPFWIPVEGAAMVVASHMLLPTQRDDQLKESSPKT